MSGRLCWAILIATITLLGCVLSFHQTTGAAPRGESRAPFANAVGQRAEMIKELQGIRALLSQQNSLLIEQNKLLRSGELKVVLSQSK